MNCAQTPAIAALSSIARWRTRRRRAVFVEEVDVGLASSDWQMPPIDHVRMAPKFVWRICHRWYTSGMLATKIRAFGSPALSAVNAVSSCERRVATGVIVDSLDVQTSFA